MTMAVPGPVTGSGSLGCHERIKDNRAQLVTGADDIRALLGAAGALDVAEQYELAFAATPVQALSRNELRVYDAVEPRGSEAQEVAAAAGLALPLTVHLLLDLTRRGLINREGTIWRRADTL